MSTLFSILLLMSFSNVVDYHDVVVLCLADVDVVVGKRERQEKRATRERRE